MKKNIILITASFLIIYILSNIYPLNHSIPTEKENIQSHNTNHNSKSTDTSQEINASLEKKSSKYQFITNEESKNTIADTLQKYATSSNRDEKLHSIGALATLTANSEKQEEISDSLSKIFSIATNDEDLEVRSYAVMIFSRLGDPNQAFDLLQSSLINQTIDSDTYYSELARIYFKLEPNTNLRTKIFDEVSTSESEYTADVIFSIIPQSDLSSLSKIESEKLISYLETNRPNFPSDFTSLGISNTITYTNWALSFAKVSTKSSNPEVLAKYLLSHFKNGFNDPREAVSITLLDPFKNNYQSENISALNKLLWEETLRYANSYPDNQVIQSIGIPKINLQK